LRRLASEIAQWIQHKVSASDCTGVVLGMSGGIDSSVVAVLCQHALPRSTLGLILPCHSSPQDKEHAQLVVNKFTIDTKTVVLDGTYDTLLGPLPSSDRLIKANLKARLRMLVLYYFANYLNCMVVGSSNRSELAIGYFTKYGDGGVDIMPLGNLVKGQVRELATFLDIPQMIIDKPPSAGLWDGQTDEEEMGLSYDDLDNYLQGGFALCDTEKRIKELQMSARHKLSMPSIFKRLKEVNND